GSPQMAGPPQGMPQRPPMPPQGPPQGMPPQMPQGMPQAAGGQPALDWRMIMQKVQQANPGAPPNALASAVDRFIPLMNQQSQMQWREMSLQLREQALQQQYEMRMRALDQGDQRLGQGQQRIDTNRELNSLPPGGQYTSQQVNAAQ